MGELTASIAHELNQPLAAILSNAQAANRFLNGESPDLAEVQKCLTDIVADDKRAGEVIKRFRSPLKKDEFQASVVDLNEVVGDVIRLIRNDALLRGASVTFEPCPDLPPVLGDRIQVHQVVLNLIVNGLQATAERRSGDRWVLVRTAEVDGGRVELSVEDSGKGIAEGDWRACLSRSSQLSGMVWGWGSQSAGRLYKPMAGGFGLRIASEAARSSVACGPRHNRPRRHLLNKPYLDRLIGGLIARSHGLGLLFDAGLD